LARDFDAEIESAKARGREVKGELALRRQQFVEAAGAYFAEWFDSTARQFVREQGEVTELLEGERLSALKREVAQSSALAQEQLNKPEQWYDLGAPSYWTDVGSDRLPHNLQDGMRHVASLLTGILERYGYQKPPFSGGEFVWTEWSHTTSRGMSIVPQPGAGTFTVYEARMDPRFLDPLRAYGKLSGQLSDARTQLGQLVKAKSAAAAEDRWDKA
jgi:hypothetical protein